MIQFLFSDEPVLVWMLLVPGTFKGLVEVSSVCCVQSAELPILLLGGHDMAVVPPVHTGPIITSATSTIKARAFKDGLLFSQQVSRTYVILEQPEPDKKPLTVPVEFTEREHDG
ncbi:MAG: hypothetical protein N3G20_07840 [Verrucomicrobiae bacterium]|nr:hypothetical protein [Verrucomicrobiae bacterium]